MVAADKVKFGPGVPQLGEGAQHLEVPGEHGVLVLEPKIEEVADADNAAELGGSMVFEEGDKLPVTRPVFQAYLEVNIGKDEGFAHSGPILLSGQKRNTARPMICSSSIGPMTRLSLLTPR